MDEIDVAIIAKLLEHASGLVGMALYCDFGFYAGQYRLGTGDPLYLRAEELERLKEGVQFLS